MFTRVCIFNYYVCIYAIFYYKSLVLYLLNETNTRYDEVRGMVSLAKP